MPYNYLISKFRKRQSLYNSGTGFNPNELRNKNNLTRNMISSEGDESRNRTYFPGIYGAVPGGIAEVNEETYMLLSETSDILLAENNDILNS